MQGMENVQQDEAVLDQLPVAEWYGDTIYHWKGFWMLEAQIEAIKAIEAHFEPHRDDVLLASFPKSGTTWLKALIYTILHVGESGDQDQLLKYHPQELVPFIEMQTYGKNTNPDLSHMADPRIFSTHLPYGLLPDSIKSSPTRIVYVARNPKDTLVSLWHFFKDSPGKPLRSFEEAFNSFCKGTMPSGHFADHVLEYWNARERVFFITYEELKRDPHKHVKSLAEFLGHSLSVKQVEDVVKRCSLKRMRDLQTCRGNLDILGHDSQSFFRRGEVGDWKKHLTDEMTLQLDDITRRRFHGAGLFFNEL